MALSEREVTLQEVLDARENRVARQERLLAGGGTLISFTLNIAGEVKRFPLADRAFGAGLEAILTELNRQGWQVLSREDVDAVTGLEAALTVDAEPVAVKAAMTGIEEAHGLGRLFDIDVLGPAGKKLGRGGMDLPPRGCLVCGEPGPGCARSRAHSLEELGRVTRGIIQGYFERQTADSIAGCAVRALLYEVSVTPKPGLVDRQNSGSHRDMDFFTFLDSAAALTAYFRDMALGGLGGTPPEQLLARLRYRGILAEREMLEATGGINTHKGLVFSMGVVAAACGHLAGGPEEKDADAILGVAGRIAAPALAGDLPGVTEKTAATYGETLYARHGLTGVRGQAAAGFPAVSEVGLPLLRRLMDEGFTLEEAAVAVLLHLMAEVEDTNIITRGGVESQKRVRREMAKWTAVPHTAAEYIAKAAELDEEFMAANLSPGGCADLLALTFMLHFVTS